MPNASDVVVRERELLAKRPALLGGTIGTFDDLFRRLAPPQRTATDAQQGFVLRRAVAKARLNGLSTSARSGGFPDALREVVRELEGGLIEPRRARGRSRRAVRRLPGGARGARPGRPRARASRCRPPADDGLRGVARRARLRLRLRGSDRRRVEPAGGACRARRGDGLAPVRARPGRVRRAADDGGRSRRPRRPDRGAPAAVRRDRAPGDRPPGAAAVRGRSFRRAAARGCRPLLRGRGRPRCARARRRGRARARARGHGAGADRDRLPGARALARAARDGLLDPRDPVCAGDAPPPAADPLRRGAARPAPLRVARRRA